MKSKALKNILKNNITKINVGDVDMQFHLGLGLIEDFKKNIPWNRKMLAGYINNKAIYTKEDIENFK